MRRSRKLAPGSVYSLLAALPGFVVGSGLQLQQPVLWMAHSYLLLFAAGALALAAVWRYRDSGVARAGLLLLPVALLAFALTGWRAAQFQQQSLAAELEGRDILVTGLVAAMPQVNEVGSRFRMRVESAELDGRPVQTPRHISLGWYSGNPGWVGNGDAVQLLRQPERMAVGERWRMVVRLKAPHGNLNPHGFDYELWLWEQGIQATGYVRSGPADPAPQRLALTPRYPVEALRQTVRDRILERVPERTTAGLIAALVVGDQNAIDRSDWDVFRATGVAHLMSISGLHVTMFAWLAAALVGALWRRSSRMCLWLSAPHAAILGGLGLATAYALFSGWGVPAQRTVWMLFTVGLLRLSARQWPWPSVWILACAVVVAVDPWALTQAGFWLSFVAVGVLYASGSGAEVSAGTWQRVRALVREQWVVTLALTPLGLLLFGQASVVGFVANLLAIPWVTLVVTPLALAGVLLGPLWALAAAAITLLTGYLDLLVQLPFASISVARAPWWAGVAGLLGGLLLAMRLPWSLRGAGIPLLLPVLLWRVPAPMAGEFEVLAADIGQGNAVLVRTANHALLYDTGPRFSRESDAGHRVLVPLLRAMDIHLDKVVLSHKDSDHIGGAVAVLAMQTGAQLLSSIASDHELQGLRSVERCHAGQSWQWDGVTFSVLHPQAADYLGAVRPNALSCVLRITTAGQGAGARSALLAGDIERAQEQRLAYSGQDIKADVLLAPHHGSKTSSSAEFLDAVAPAIVVVQAGYRNRFGHPAAAVLERYRDRRITVEDSPHCGAFTWRSWIPEQGVCQRRETQRYWHHVAP